MLPVCHSSLLYSSTEKFVSFRTFPDSSLRVGLLFQLLCCRSSPDLINTCVYSFACPSREGIEEQRKVGTKGKSQLGGLAVVIVSQRDPLCICAYVAI